MNDKKIYKSFINNITDKQFKSGNKSNTSGFVFYNDLLTSSIIEIINLDRKERIQGLVFEEEGVKVYIQQIK